MPLGLVRLEEFEIELNRFHSNNGNGSIEIKHGRGNKSETPEILRELVASESISGANSKELSREFNVSESSISAYKNGATSTASYHNPDMELKKANDRTRDHISGKAQSKLIAAIDSIDFQDKIKPQIASAIARDMSSVIKNLNPNPDIAIQNNQVLVYRPRMREEDSYETIQIDE